jgi:hypothetical protein
MISRRAIAVSAGVAVVLVGAIGLYEFIRVPTHVGETPTDILRRNGYLEIRPATALDGPGTIVTIDLRTPDYVMLHLTCNMDGKELSDFWKSSNTINTNVADQLNGEFRIAADALKQIGLTVIGNAISEIDMKFENTKIIEVSDESLYALRDKYLKGNCLKAISQLIARNNNVCVTQPVAAMEADITYDVKYSDNVSASDKAKITSGLSGALASGGETASTDQIVGKGLFVGVRLDSFCYVLNDGRHDNQQGPQIATMPVTPAAFTINANLPK